LSFKFIAVAYGMLGATAATGYMVQGSGGNGTAGKRPTSGHVAEAPKVERVAKLEMPPKPGPMPQVAMVATSQHDESVVTTAPAAIPGAMLLTAPPTPPPPPAEAPSRMAAHAEKPAEKPVEKAAEEPAEKPPEKLAENSSEKPAGRSIGFGGSRKYMQITADMMVNPWTGEWLTSDDRAMGYISGPATGTAPAAAPAPVMVADAQPAAPETPVAAITSPPPPPEPAPLSALTAPGVIPVITPIPTVSTPSSKKTAHPPATQKAEGQQHEYMAHLASYRDEVHAAAGWKTLQKAHRDLLINRTPVTVTAEIPGQGTFVRLMAGGFSQLADVSEFCSEFKASGQYCTAVKAK
jgi:hypothetical protein